MARTFVDMRYFETYYYASVIHNVLADSEVFLRPLNDWHEDNAESIFLTPYPKWSVLHSLCAHVIGSLIDEHVGDVELDSVVSDASSQLWVDEALRYHGFPTDGFRCWLKDQGIPLTDATEDNIADYHWELQLSGHLGELLDQLAGETFYLLFGNRLILANLNEYAALIVSGLTVDGLAPEFQRHLAADGRLARAHIPEWAKKAVFHRDRGLCTSCGSDISGLLSVQYEDSFDHIIPLARGGLNDVTNLQLLCGSCNRNKGVAMKPVSARYESWY